MIKIAVLVIMIDIAQSVDLELMNMSRNALFAKQNVSMPHTQGIALMAHPISNCDTCTLFEIYTSEIYNKSACHNTTTPPTSPCGIPGLPSCNLTSPTPIMTNLLLAITFPWCVENYAPASTPLGEIPRERCKLVVEMRTESHVDITPSAGREEKDLQGCFRRTPSLQKLFTMNQWCVIPPPTGTFWLCGTSVYRILPSQFNGRCTLVYVLPAIRKNLVATPSSPHLHDSALTTNREFDCIPGLTCTQTWWSKTLEALIPFYGAMHVGDQVRSFSKSVRKLGNDTVFILANIDDDIVLHNIRILKNRVTMDYVLATQGGACAIIGPECCNGLRNPIEKLCKLLKDLKDFEPIIHQLKDSSWFSSPFRKPWLWIKEIAIVLVSFLVLLYQCMCFIKEKTHTHHEERTVPNIN